MSVFLVDILHQGARGPETGTIAITVRELELASRAQPILWLGGGGAGGLDGKIRSLVEAKAQNGSNASRGQDSRVGNE